jgi:hypothetical protein
MIQVEVKKKMVQVMCKIQSITICIKGAPGNTMPEWLKELV